MSDNSPRIEPFLRLVESSSREELVWLHGYLSGKLGLLGGSSPPASQQGAGQIEASRSKINRFTLAYGTETGNSKQLAIALTKKAKERGFQVKLVAIDQYRLKDLPNETHFFLVVSTQGDGEPPAAALSFFEFIQQNDLKLESLNFAVLGLGDSAYPQFCQAGIDADKYLAERGAQRLQPLVKCDQIYEEDGDKWLTNIISLLEAGAAVQIAGNLESVAAPPPSGKVIYQGEIIMNVNLNDEPSAKETHHIEIRCDDEIHYAPGDAAGFVPGNPGPLVNRVLTLLQLSGNETVTFRGTAGQLRETLSQRVNLTFLPERVIRKYAERTSQAIEMKRANFDDLLQAHPPGSVEITALLEIMEPIVPRLYSISSSPAAHPGELHLTVAKNTFCNEDGTLGSGLCSSFLCQLAEESMVEFHIHKNHAFKLPAPEQDIIMVGPGTGIAPFRSFLFERDAMGASGRNWLFFGEQHFVTDFLY